MQESSQNALHTQNREAEKPCQTGLCRDLDAACPARRRMVHPAMAKPSVPGHGQSNKINAPPPADLVPPTSLAQTQSARMQSTPAPYSENHPHTTTIGTGH